MEQEHGPQLKAESIPRLSRLPMLRPSHGNLRLANTASKREPVKTSTLPRPARSQVSPIVPLGENVNTSLRDRYGWQSRASSVRSRSPVRDAIEAAQTSALETTPPNSAGEQPVFVDGDENSTAPKDERKPRQRMSLSQRTVGTLSQVSPSPSPTRRRRKSQASSNGRMAPTARPASSMRDSRPTTPARSRSQSPTKQPFRIPGRSESPSRQVPLPAVPSPGSLFSPPRALVKGRGSRIGKPAWETNRSVSNTAVVDEPATAPKPLYTAQTMRVKTPHYDKSHSNHAQKSLEALFKEPAPRSQRSLSSVSSNQTSGLLKPRSRGENTIALSPSPKTKQSNTGIPVTQSPKTLNVTKDELSSPSGPKSSAALRESIAQAKAARKKITSTTLSVKNDIDLWLAKDDLPSVSAPGHEGGKEVIRQRIQGALVSGQLNISAMQFSSIPDEVMKMYQPTESSVPWNEVVDLSKLIAADNQIERLQDNVFPDFSMQEIVDDDEKINQFAGLQVIDFHNNALTALPVGLRRLERLTSLNLNGNCLTNDYLDIIWQLPQLQHLNLGRNKLSGAVVLPARAIAHIRVLSLQENQIESITIGEGAQLALVKLDVSSNRLKDLPWEDLSSCDLVELDVHENHLTTMAVNPALAGFTSLKQLDLSRNSLEVIEPTLSLSSMQVFKVNSNQLDSLPDFSSWHSLMTLHASENKLTELPSGLQVLQQLKSIDLSNNNVKVINPTVANSESLTTLQLGGNPLRDRKYLLMDFEAIKNDLLKKLESPITSNTLATSHTDNPPATSTTPPTPYKYIPQNGNLDLSSQSLTTIPLSLIDLTHPVQHLRLSNNDLPTLPLPLLLHPSIQWTLTSLDLSHNPLLPENYVTTPLFLPALQSLYIVSTGLSTLDALTTNLRAPSLTSLNISCHRLSGHLPWLRAWYPSLNTLLATDNWFSSVDVEAVRGLEVLDIKNNEIEKLPAKIGLLGNKHGRVESGRLKVLEVQGNRFRVPRWEVLERGTEAVLRDLRRMVPEGEAGEWEDEI